MFEKFKTTFGEGIRKILRWAKEKPIWRRLRDFSKLFTTRCVLVIESFIFISLMSCSTGDDTFWYGSFCVLVIVLETIYLFAFNNSKDFYVFSVTFTAFWTLYLGCSWKAAALVYQSGNLGCDNKTLNKYISEKNCLRLSLNTCEISYVVSVVFLLTLVYAKWRTPFSNRFTLSTYSAQVILLLSLTADVFDFLDYGNDTDIIAVVGVNSIYDIALYAVFLRLVAILCISLIQFSFNMLAKRDFASKPPKNFFYKKIDFILGTETWSILLGTFTQDVPYFIFRIYILITCGFFVDPSTLFFVLRNFFMIILANYRIHGLYKEYKESRLKSSNKVEPEPEPENPIHSIEF